MRLMTVFQLAGIRESELRSLLRQAFNKLAKKDLCSNERKNVLAYIDAIQRELAARQHLPLPK